MSSDAPRTSRLSSLSSRLAMLIAIVLVASGLITALYSAFASRGAAEDSTQQSMSNAHESTSLLIQQSYENQKQYRTDALETRKTLLSKLTEVQIATLDNLRAAVGRGELTQKQAQDFALKQLLDFRYDKTNYFFTYTPDMVALENPNPKFLGNQLDTKDANGKYFFRDFRDVALGPGSGYVDYVGTRLGSTTPAPKISYIQYYEPWQWVLGTGVYIDDIDKAVSARLEQTKASLAQQFASSKFGETGFFFLLDKDGKVAVAPTGKDLSALESTDWGRELSSNALKAGSTAVDGPVTLNQTAAFNQGLEPWSLEVSAVPQLGWTLVSAVPRAEVEGPGNASAIRQALLGLGVLLVGLLIGLLSSRRIVRPVATMTKAALALEQDSFDPAMLNEAADRRDEVGTLARAFQRMGTEVVERERKLREQVKKLTVVIDRQKVADEVGAIAESDYFKQLQERSTKIRDRDEQAPSE